MLFGGFGPIVLAIIYLIVSHTVSGFSLGGAEVCLGIVSTYLLAFLHAGASVFNQIEHWPIAKSLFFHFLSLYVAYSSCYLLNSWIPFDLVTFLIFTGIFVAVYAVVWLTVYLVVRHTGKGLNRQLGA